MFLHGSWAHPRKHVVPRHLRQGVEGAFRALGYLAFFARWLRATITQSLVTPCSPGGTPRPFVPSRQRARNRRGIGAFFVVSGQGLTLVFVFPVRLSAWVFLGVWFIYRSSRLTSG
jgi:hypothetical protein